MKKQPGFLLVLVMSLLLLFSLLSLLMLEKSKLAFQLSENSRDANETLAIAEEILAKVARAVSNGSLCTKAVDCEGRYGGWYYRYKTLKLGMDSRRVYYEVRIDLFAQGGGDLLVSSCRVVSSS